MKIIGTIMVSCLCICLSLKGKSEVNQGKGISWIENLSWEKILLKAKAEHRYIFVDCYATWCGPCKVMDKNVYPDERVGAVVNEKFIAVKVQMDKTDKDDEQIKQWYNDAKKIQTDFKVDAYPTLLFFSPDGNLVHRVTQGLNIEGFLDVVSMAVDPAKGYYSRLSDYQNGKKDTTSLKGLIKAAEMANYKEMAAQIAEEYFTKIKAKNLYNKEIRELVLHYSKSSTARELATTYINSLKEKELFNKDNIFFIRRFTNNTSQRGFRFYYDNIDKINSIMDRGEPLSKGTVRSTQQSDYAQSAIRWVIYNQEFLNQIYTPAIQDSSNVSDPDWSKLASTIRTKYPKIDAERIVMDAKDTWYSWRSNWAEYSKNKLAEMVKTYSGKSLKGNMFYINDDCWALFERATDTMVLNRAIYWMELAFKEDPDSRNWYVGLDTYANLLYKVGKVKQALEWEAKAVALNPSEVENVERYEKMKKGEATWPQEKANFAGSWKINLEKSEYGQAPVNTLIKEIKVEQKPNQITIERKAGDEGKEVAGSETLTFDGKLSEQKLEGKVKKSSVKWSQDSKQLIEEAFYNYDKEGMDRKITEVWSLSSDGKLLTVSRNFELESGIKYSTKCIYEHVKN